MGTLKIQIEGEIVVELREGTHHKTLRGIVERAVDSGSLNVSQPAFDGWQVNLKIRSRKEKK